MGSEQIVIVCAGALAGGPVNGLTGFGTALTVLDIWRSCRWRSFRTRFRAF